MGSPASLGEVVADSTGEGATVVCGRLTEVKIQLLIPVMEFLSEKQNWNIRYLNQ